MTQWISSWGQTSKKWNRKSNNTIILSHKIMLYGYDNIQTHPWRLAFINDPNFWFTILDFRPIKSSSCTIDSSTSFCTLKKLWQSEIGRASIVLELRCYWSEIQDGGLRKDCDWLKMKDGGCYVLVTWPECGSLIGPPSWIFSPLQLPQQPLCS